ncbi:MAG: DNA polymerase III subunit gamma/tau [Bacteroidia bacterium]|nr:DNA polymerase III subunit gamma/tau [Bacteroidia bacterium]
MSEFIVSARKYRPSNFGLVVGQEHITSTLKNAIQTKHLAQAFLFCGPRGVGKTTCARILAKTINCTNLTADIEACNQCESCQSFNNGQSLNIFEMDAASNNSVEAIRDLNEQVRYAPQTGKYKIYIIDEVHMLTQAAFNAFLKTLEEPPAYAIFILATTEKHKIIPTILSRCQIFDFNRIGVKDIAAQLAFIAGKEKIQTDSNALHLIAQKADGAMRDALSVFDQIVSYAGNKVSYEDVIQNLNVIDYDYYFSTVNHILNADVSAVLTVFNDILRKGFDGHQFINGLSNHLRDLMVCKDPATVQLIETSDNIRKKYLEQAIKLDTAYLFRLLQIANQCDISYRMAKNQKLHAEIALMKMCREVPAESEKKNDSPQQRSLHINKEISPGPESKPASAANTSAANKPLHTQPEPAIASSVSEESQSEKKSLLVSEPLPLLTPSIKIRKKDKPAEAENAASTQVMQEPFEENDLLQTWHTLAENYRHAGRKNIYTTLQKRAPLLAQPSVVEFELDNHAQQKEFEEEMHELLGFMRKSLRNDSIALKLKVRDSSKPKEEAYTSAEKFRKMAEKYPALEKLRQKFDIEF